MHKASTNDWLLENLKVIQQCPLRLAINNSLKKKEFDSKPVYGDDDKYIKTKMKIYDGGMVTKFQCKKCLKKKYHASVYQ